MNTYRAVLSDGQVFTRRTARVYTHFWINLTAAAIRGPDGKRQYSGTYGFSNGIEGARQAVNRYQRNRPEHSFEIVAVTEDDA